MTVPEMQTVADTIMLDCGKPPVQVIRNNRWTNSQARMDDWKNIRRITVAEFIFNKPEEVQLAEIIHECCHFLNGEDWYILSHGEEFKEWETYWLEQIGNLKPIGYRRAYYTHLQTAAGRTIKTR